MEAHFCLKMLYFQLLGVTPYDMLTTKDFVLSFCITPLHTHHFPCLVFIILQSQGLQKLINSQMSPISLP